jgi:hypothetical protein
MAECQIKNRNQGGNLMWQIIIAWRGEILTILTWIISWILIRYWLKRTYWHLWMPGTVMGAAIEFMTEPEWNYNFQLYIWRDISPFVILGWGIVFSWVIPISDYFYQKIFKVPASTYGPRDPRLLMTDLLVGAPIFLTNELIGLHFLKLWTYNPILQWNNMIPVIQYPVEGLVSMFFFTLAIPASVRYWKGNVVEAK